MSLYAEYVRERLGDSIIENEFGFATYRFLNENQVYIIDIYIKPEFRRTHAASAIADAIVDEARARGCRELMGTVVPSAKGSTESLKTLLGYGMSLRSSAQDVIVFKKDI